MALRDGHSCWLQVENSILNAENEELRDRLHFLEVLFTILARRVHEAV